MLFVKKNVHFRNHDLPFFVLYVVMDIDTVAYKAAGIQQSEVLRILTEFTIYYIYMINYFVKMQNSRFLEFFEENSQLVKFYLKIPRVWEFLPRLATMLPGKVLPFTLNAGMLHSF